MKKKNPIIYIFNNEYHIYNKKKPENKNFKKHTYKQGIDDNDDDEHIYKTLQGIDDDDDKKKDKKISVTVIIYMLKIIWLKKKLT